MNTFINRIKSLKAFSAVMNDPTQTEEIFKLADLGRARKGLLLKEAVESIADQPGVRDLFTQNYLPTLPPITELNKYTDGTLGKAYAQHMLTNGLEPDFFPKVTGEPLETYLTTRGRGIHDLWHVITGYDTNIPSEIGLQGFTLAQLRSPFSAVLISAGFLHAVSKAPELFQTMIDQTFEGYAMGLKAKPIFGIKIEERMHENLDDLRREFEITPAHVPRNLHLSVS